MKLHNQILIFVGGLFLLVIILFYFVFEDIFLNNIKLEVGKRALSIAQTTAEMNDVRDAFDDAQPEKTLVPIANNIKNLSKAEYVVIGNTKEIRYAHPIPDRIGKKMVGGDNTEVLKGHTIISESVGSMGASLRGKAPVFDDTRKVIGIVSVGFLLTDIEKQLDVYRKRWISFSLLLLVAGITGSFIVAYQVRKSLLGYEPNEIAALYSEQQAIVNAIQEGIIAIDNKGIITLMNPTAKKILHREELIDPVGQHINKIIPDSRLPELLTSRVANQLTEGILDGEIVYINRVPIISPTNKIIGAVESFRSKNEIVRLTEELNTIKNYAEGLRAQTHEFSNKLHTLAGLIQLGEYDDAIHFINEEAKRTQKMIELLQKQISDPVITGLLIGKLNEATERKILLSISESSNWSKLPPHLSKNDMVTIIGNLIDNSMEAVEKNERVKLITLHFIEYGEDLIFEIEDNGVGMSLEEQKLIFKQGYTSKKEGHNGFGLAIVEAVITKYEGFISLYSRKDEGTTFTVILPKNIKNQENNY